MNAEPARDQVSTATFPTGQVRRGRGSHRSSPVVCGLEPYTSSARGSFLTPSVSDLPGAGGALVLLAALQGGAPRSSSPGGRPRTAPSRSAWVAPCAPSAWPALDDRIAWGVWGGMAERERRALLKRRPDVTSWRVLLETARAEQLRQGQPAMDAAQPRTA